MLYDPGTHLTAIVDVPVVDTNWKQDTVNVISSHQEVIVIKRATIAYVTGMATITRIVVATINADWQANNGNTTRDEPGLKVKWDARLIAPAGVDVQEGDEAYRADDSFEYVNYVKRYGGHTTIYLTKQKGSN